MSAPVSPASTHRRLSARRGSVSASDPWAKNAHINLDPNRSSSSTLTIVRVISPPTNPSSTVSLQEPPSSPVLSQRRLHRRIQSNSSVSSNSSDRDSPAPASTRLSFAFSSFAGTGPASGGPASTKDSSGGSPNSSPRLRPSSPSRRPGSFSNPRLSPDQLLDLARQSTNPRHIPPASTPPSYSPVLGRSQSPLGFNPLSLPPSAVSPATFTPLPSDIYLPFIDRPSEVAALISSPPSAKLFALLAQTFPKTADPSTPTLPKDPTTWSFAHLTTWLTNTDRNAAPDPLWVLNARKCILYHSELIWERLKGALGVPPELDIDLNVDELSDDGSDGEHVVSEDEGRRAHGHWDDWDAVMDSPVFDRRVSATGADDDRFPPSQSSDSPTPLPPPSLDVGVNHQYLTIEPLLAPPSSQFTPSPSANPPPLSLSGSLSLLDPGLQDISEDAEEEAEAEASEETGAGVDTAKTSIKDDDDKGIDPTQIQGLRISTTRMPADPTSPVLDPVSPLPPYPSTHSQPVSRSASFSSVRSAAFRRSDSFGSSGRPRPHLGRGGDGHDSDRDVPYDPVGDRSPGNPLFPSNFARLALGPTLSANNPSLRTPTHPPAPKYGSNPYRRDSSSSFTFFPASSKSRSNSNTNPAPTAQIHRAAGVINSGAGIPIGILGGDGIARGSRFRRRWSNDYAVSAASESSVGAPGE